MGAISKPRMSGRAGDGRLASVRTHRGVIATRRPSPGFLGKKPQGYPEVSLGPAVARGRLREKPGARLRNERETSPFSEGHQAREGIDERLTNASVGVGPDFARFVRSVQ